MLDFEYYRINYNFNIYECNEFETPSFFNIKIDYHEKIMHKIVGK
jgi:hypothetical protein